MDIWLENIRNAKQIMYLQIIYYLLFIITVVCLSLKWYL